MAIAPDILEDKLNLAEQCLQKDNYVKALDHVEAILRVDLEQPRALCLMADICLRVGNPKESLKYATMAYEIDNSCLKALQHAGNIFLNNKEYYKSINLMSKILEQDPKHEIALWAIAFAYFKLEKMDLAYPYIQKCIATGKKLKSLHVMEGSYFLNEACQINKAIRCFKKDITTDPNAQSANLMIASALSRKGEIEEAIKYSKKQISVKSNNTVSHDNLIMYMHYAPNIEHQEILDAAKNFYKCCYPKFYEKEADRANYSLYDFSHLDLSVNKKDFKIGFVSGDFKKHSVFFWLRDFFEHLAKKYKVFCYCNNYEDEATAILKKSSHKWTDITKMDDDAAAEEIRKDKVDILFDLSGHTALNRLGVFVRRPAPTQVSWVGFSGPHGLPQIDYILSDKLHSPDDEDHHYTEKIYKLPQTLAPLAQPSLQDIEIEKPPVLKNNYITFGCLNNFLKLHKGVIELYSRVLKQVEDSKLLFKTKVAHDQEVKKEILSCFKSHGIKENRIIWETYALNKMDYLKAFNKVDISLDTYPYGGGTTTVDGLWMGTPLITINGKRMSHRTASVFSTLSGHPEFVAKNKEEYIEKAVALAQNTNKIKHYKENLRQDLNQSPILDVESYIKDFEIALKDMWNDCVKNYKR